MRRRTSPCCSSSAPPAAWWRRTGWSATESSSAGSRSSCWAGTSPAPCWAWPGFGRIARATARRALGFGMEVVFSPRPPGDRPVSDEELGEFAGKVRQVPWTELVERSDFLSLHVPLNEQTRHLVDAGRAGADEAGRHPDQHRPRAGGGRGRPGGGPPQRGHCRCRPGRVRGRTAAGARAGRTAQHRAAAARRQRHRPRPQRNGTAQRAQRHRHRRRTHRRPTPSTRSSRHDHPGCPGQLQGDLHGGRGRRGHRRGRERRRPPGYATARRRRRRGDLRRTLPQPADRAGDCRRRQFLG